MAGMTSRENALYVSVEIKSSNHFSGTLPVSISIEEVMFRSFGFCNIQ